MDLSDSEPDDEGFISPLLCNTPQSMVAICCSNLRDWTPVIYHWQLREGGSCDPTMSHSTPWRDIQISLINEAQDSRENINTIATCHFPRTRLHTEMALTFIFQGNSVERRMNFAFSAAIKDYLALKGHAERWCFERTHWIDTSEDFLQRHDLYITRQRGFI